MPCYSPLRAQRSASGNVRVLKAAAVFDFSLPCGRCIGCRLHYSQMWAIRCVHEASLHSENCCVTLTYRPDSLPVDGNLVYRDFQLFLKRLRKFCAPVKVRFFCGGEYGEKNMRPHFHALLFGFDFKDKVVYSERDGVPVLWTSAQADSLWKLGNVVVGEASFDSAAYIARYMLKKVHGDLATLHYADPDTGVMLNPEFAHMSLKPGIGFDWMRLYASDVFADLKLVSRGKKVSLPRYYLKYLSRLAGYDEKILKRKLDMGRLWRDNTPRRLKDKARCAAARLGLSRRVL